MANTPKRSAGTSGGKSGSRSGGSRSTSAGSRAGGKKSTAKGRRPIRREVGGAVCLLLALCAAIGYFQTEG